MKIEKEKQIQTLILGDKGGRTYLRAPQPAFAARHKLRLASTGPPLAAGTHARGLQSEAPSTASSTAARSPNGDRARRRARR